MILMPNRFQDKVIIITGSTRGIGLATAKAFLAEGARVVVFCRHLEHGEVIIPELREVGEGRFLTLAGDVGDIQDVKRIVATTMREWGKLDILVNNAGAAVWKNIEETSEEEYDMVIDTNLKGAFLFSREVIPIMKQKNYGRIIHISSGLGIRAREKYSAYCTSKFGLIGLSQVLADELKNFDIRSYVLCPGAVATKLHLDVHPWEDPKQMMQSEDVAPYILDAADDKYPAGECVIVEK